MKKFYNNTKISRAFSKALRVVALLCVLMGFSASAWAGAGFFDYDAMNIKYYPGTGDTDIWISGGIRANSTVDLTSSINGTAYLKGLSVQTWKDGCDNNDENNCDGKICEVKVVVKMDGTNKGEYSLDWSANTTGTTYNQTWKNENIDIQFPNTAGEHTIILECTAKGNSSSNNGDCNTTYTMTGTIKYTIGGGGGGGDTWYLKHPWAGSNEWTWKQLTHFSGTTYTLTAQYSSTSNVVGFNYNTKADGDGQGYTNPTINCFPASTTENCVITFDSETKEITVEPAGGCPPPNMPGAMGDCKRIEIYSKNNYNLYAVQDGKGIAGNYGTGAINNTTKGTEVTYNSKTYFKYYIEDYEYIQIAFKNSSGNKTGLSNKLYGGYAYIFDDDYTLDASGTNHAFPSSYNYADCSDPATIVLLSKEAVVNKTSKEAVLYGYIKQTNCENILDYGFYYCRVPDGDKCKPDQKSTRLQVASSKALLRSQDFSAELVLEDGYTYYYRAYANVGTEVLSQEIRSISTDPCKQQVCCDGTVVYTINAAFEHDNVCKLEFRNLQDAIDHLTASALRNDSYAYAEFVGSSYNLKQPVVMNVVYYDDTPDDPTSAYCYRGRQVDRNTVLSAGADKPDHMLFIENINKTATNKDNTLTIKAGTKTAKPWIHHILIRESKNIVLDSLIILSDPNGEINDNALEIDVHMQSYDKDGYKEPDWGSITKVGQFEDANILIQNSMIGSAGFTGVHVSSYDGVTFKNNDFELQVTDFTKNTIEHGASAKFMFCSGIKFIQNNFRGDHATLMWIQESANMLIMNNVFWNTNGYYNKDYPTPSAIRLFAQWNKNVENIGIFYNTFYLADNAGNNSLAESNYWKYNILKMEHRYNDGSIANIVESTIKFQYNNCYSYDANVAGRESGNTPFGGKTTVASGNNFCPNNFWSQYDENKNPKPTVSAFAFGCSDNEFINVKGQVCETTASGPASLIVKGEALNEGAAPAVGFTGIAMTPVELKSDRYLTNVRPTGNTWTYGAYQSKKTIPTSVIYWVGLNEKWDDRNNWEYETFDIEQGKMVRQRVSCINELSENLKVIIEEVGTMEIAGGRKWPKVPASFDADDRKIESEIPVGEQVSAGLGKAGFTPTKFASTIELEYGAGLRGVENLKDSEGKVLYDNAIVHFDADRDKWLLVGSIVKPWDEENEEYRTGKSGDYYLEHLPQVYMHQAKVEGNDITWNKTFADLEVPVPSDEVYAINVTSMYGTSWMPAEVYNYFNKTDYKGDVPHSYTFNGRFAVAEDNVPGQVYEYGNLTAGNTYLLNNVYPCNLDANEIEEKYGSVSIYDYAIGSFVNTSTLGTDNVYIKSQNGFVFIPDPEKGINNLELNNDILAEGSTRTRAGKIPLPTFSLNVDNANTTDPGASNVVIRYDEFLGDEISSMNTPKVFTKNENTPEAYIINENGQYARLDTGKDKVCIPLGIRLQKPMNITFEKVYNEGYDEVVLVDTKTQKFYNLLKRNYTTDVLATGDTEGRFYLNLTISGDEDLEDEGDNPGGDDIVDDDNISTEVEETIEEAEINIYTVNNSIVRVSSVGTALKTIYVSDMTGRTDSYNVDGNYVELQLPVSSGVYTVTVVGETASKTGKVILK